jgi:hypothetical protein
LDDFFSTTGISLSVNKIGKTLLLDEFDVQNVLSHAAQVRKTALCFLKTTVTFVHK